MLRWMSAVDVLVYVCGGCFGWIVMLARIGYVGCCGGCCHLILYREDDWFSSPQGQPFMDMLDAAGLIKLRDRKSTLVEQVLGNLSLSKSATA